MTFKGYACEVSSLAVTVADIHKDMPQSVQGDLEKAVAGLIQAKAWLLSANEKMGVDMGSFGA